MEDVCKDCLCYKRYKHDKELCKVKKYEIYNYLKNLLPEGFDNNLSSKEREKLVRVMNQMNGRSTDTFNDLFQKAMDFVGEYENWQKATGIDKNRSEVRCSVESLNYDNECPFCNRYSINKKIKEVFKLDI